MKQGQACLLLTDWDEVGGFYQRGDGRNIVRRRSERGTASEAVSYASKGNMN